MKDEVRQAALDELDGFVTTIGLKDYEEFRSILTLAATVCENAAPQLKHFAALNREELGTRLDEYAESELESGLRRLRELRSYLPTLGALLIDSVVQVFPARPGGAPKKLTREKEREACSLILSSIKNGMTEPEAKKAAAKQLHETRQTINRTWSKRVAIMEPSPEETLLAIFKSLASTSRSPSAEPLPQSNGEKKKDDEPE